MGLIDFIRKITSYHEAEQQDDGEYYEFCPRCQANLTLQKGYKNDLPYWVCKGCGEMLINPAVPDDSDIAWICDGCGALLNMQEGFSSECGEWTCSECGTGNRICAEELFVSEDERRAYLNNPYLGMSDEDVVELMKYREIRALGGKSNVTLVDDDGKRFVKKVLTTYDASVYRYLLVHPVAHMPKIIGVYEGTGHLIIIEEYIKGKTVADLLDQGPIDPVKAVNIAVAVCLVLQELHNLEPPIIHRDIKPSNVIVTENNDAYLLDINIARWNNPEDIEDTKLLGTLYFAAPEQFGYGFSASNEKADIYALGMLLNVMVTGKLPKEQKAEGTIWNVVERCISFEPSERYTDEELLGALNSILN